MGQPANDLVRFAARDPGAARVLACFLDEWRAPNAIEVEVWTLPRATSVFTEIGCRTREFPEDFAADALAEAWRARPAAVLVTGTSHYAPFEPALWDLAHRYGCPSLAVIDQWTNLARRFPAGRPDVIGAIDERQAEELRTLGFADAEVVVVGHPVLARLAREHEPAPAGPGADGPVRVLFASERIAQDVAEEVNAPYGFDELDAFRVLQRGACRAATAGVEVAIAVKPHPYEEPALFQRRAAELPAPPGLTVRHLEPGEAPYPWLRWADLVVGIGSVLLLEAIVLGKTVLSLQPNLAREDTFVAAQLGFARTLTDPDEGERAVFALIVDPAERERERARHAGFIRMIRGDRTAALDAWIRRGLRGARVGA